MTPNLQKASKPLKSQSFASNTIPGFLFLKSNMILKSFL